MKKKSAFWRSVKIFALENDLTLKEVAEKSGVDYGTMRACLSSEVQGVTLMPKVQAYMDNYKKGGSDDHAQI